MLIDTNDGIEYTYSFQIKYLNEPERRALQFYRSWQDDCGGAPGCDGVWHEEIYTTAGWKEAEPWQQTPVEELPQDREKNRARATQRGNTSAPTGSTTDSTSTS